MIEIRCFTVNAFAENTYLVFDDLGNGLVIDPGFMNTSESDAFDAFVQANNINLRQCLQTHCHIDHILGVHHINQKYGLKTRMHPNELIVFESGRNVSAMYGLPYKEGMYNDEYLANGMNLLIGEIKCSVHFTPGHSPGSVCFYFYEQHLLIAGDLIFKGSVGRTDLPGGDHDELINSVRNEVFVLPHHTLIYSGHGEPTDVGQEKLYNPFFN
jgi:glyoxylase-like metal-dependent hydrolase (beta-lactamase superfamily II)